MTEDSRRVPVAVDAYALATRSAYRGIGTYLRAVIDGLSARDDIALTAVATTDTSLPDGVGRVDLGRLGPARLQAAIHDRRLPGLIARTGSAVFHSPAQAPPRSSPIPWVHTLLDLTPLVFVHPELEAERRRWLAIGPRLAEAAAVICISQSSADQARDLLGLDPRRLHVVYLGIDQSYRPGPRPDVAAPYLLMVSVWAPHKGFREAIAAVSALAEEGLPHKLVIAGDQAEWGRRRIRETIAEVGGRADRIELLDYVPDLVNLYRGADAVLVPSHAEGFGLPAAEALACGAPVIAADATSLPEVVGDAGVLVAPGDMAAWINAVRAVVSDPARSEDLRLRGPSQARKFTWAESIRRHAEVITSVV